MNAFPLNFGPDGAGDARFHRTSKGERSRRWKILSNIQCCERILDGGAWQIQDYDENIEPIGKMSKWETLKNQWKQRFPE